MVAQGAAAVVGGDDAPAEGLESLPERLLGEVADVEDHPGFLQGPQHRGPPRGEAPGCLGAVGVGADPVVAEADDAQTLVPPLRHLLLVDDAVGPLHREHVTERRRGAVPLPIPQVGVEAGGVADLPENPLRLHQPVIGDLAPALGAGDILGAHPGEALSHGGQAAAASRHEQADFAASQLVEADDVEAAPLACHSGFGLPYLPYRLQQVAVPLQGVMGDIEV